MVSLPFLDLLFCRQLWSGIGSLSELITTVRRFSSLKITMVSTSFTTFSSLKR